MPVVLEPEDIINSVPVKHFGGVVRGAQDHIEFADDHPVGGYFARVANDSPYNLTFGALAYSGDYPFGRLYYGNIFSHRTVGPYSQTGISWYDYDWDSQLNPATTLAIIIDPGSREQQAYDIVVLVRKAFAGSEPVDAGGIVCPANPAYPYRDTVVDSSSRQRGVVPHGRSIAGAKRPHTAL
jgi:hypothetical protein